MGDLHFMKPSTPGLNGGVRMYEDSIDRLMAMSREQKFLLSTSRDIEIILRLLIELNKRIRSLEDEMRKLRDEVRKLRESLEEKGDEPQGCNR